MAEKPAISMLAAPTAPTGPSIDDQLRDAHAQFKDMLESNLSLKENIDTDGYGKAKASKSDDHSGNNVDDSNSKSRKSDKSGYSDDTSRDKSARDMSGDTDMDRLDRIKRFMRRRGDAFVRNFVDYGPPYNGEEFDPILVTECSKPVFNFWEVHNLLNARMDPNEPDPDDLYYTPLHWCARNAHVLGIRMLLRAGAKLELTNEMGIDALAFACMIKFPKDKRKDQLKTISLLLQKGASVHNRDKSGQSPLDYAATNQDVQVVHILLDHGATVLRENRTLVAERAHILKNVYDPECYRVLYERLLFEERALEMKKEKYREVEQLVEEEKTHKKLHRDLAKKKEQRMLRDKNAQEEKRAEELLIERKKKIQAEMESNLQETEKKKVTKGIWKRDTTGHWEFFKTRPFKLRNEVLYEESLKTVQELHAKNAYDKYNSMWEGLSAGGKLEMKWARSDPFKWEGMNVPAIGNADGGSRLNTAQISAGAKNPKTVDVDFRDENDEELEGENLDDLLASLTSI